MLYGGYDAASLEKIFARVRVMSVKNDNAAMLF
jgi:hypothetical protein